jgi:hypothetical protein
LEIFRDYETVLKNLSATILRAPADDHTGSLIGRFSRNNLPVYVAVVPKSSLGDPPDGEDYDLYIAEEKEFVPTIK